VIIQNIKTDGLKFPEGKIMEPCLVAERDFNLFLFIMCLIAMPIYLVTMLIAVPLSRFEKPDPFAKFFQQQQENFSICKLDHKVEGNIQPNLFRCFKKYLLYSLLKIETEQN